MDFGILLSIWKLLSSWRTTSRALVPRKLKRFTTPWPSSLMSVVFCKQLSCGINAYDEVLGPFSCHPEIMTTRAHNSPPETNVPGRYWAAILPPPPPHSFWELHQGPQQPSRHLPRKTKIIIITTTILATSVGLHSWQRGSQALSHLTRCGNWGQRGQPVARARHRGVRPPVWLLQRLLSNRWLVNFVCPLDWASGACIIGLPITLGVFG